MTDSSLDPRWQALFQRRALGIRLGLEAVEGAFRHLGRPAADVPAVHVVGTNGKGSVAAMVAHALGRRGRKVGLYTSPHLHRVSERVRVHGEPVEERRLLAAVERVMALDAAAGLPRPLSFFELLTLAAMLLFHDHGVDVIVAEAGLGGRLDATRLVSARAHAITRIALDHQAWLGTTLAAIAAEKAGVLTPAVPVLSAPQHAEVAAVLRETAERVGAPLRFVEPLARSPRSLTGEHQRENAAVALAVARELEAAVEPDDLDDVAWPGRLEHVPVGAGMVVLDVAHNPDGIATLCARLAHHRDGEHIVVFGCLADKDAGGMLRLLSEAGRPLWLVPPPVAGAADPEPPPGRNRRFAGVDDPAFVRAFADAVSRGATLWVCGSHVLVGVLRARVCGLDDERPQPADPGAGR